ncbi:hypothetical protein [Paenibacillus sp. Aloe-11]|uniref:hypothetical protein n=1 Tax=Paenibacillus sp. Aloe-11 TaxID=1050222 RepID=UPI00024EFFB9|nr:hypothetical protein [Paenibacillus sp. Aloe-11]EHS59468.1 hypothetical protein WG8_0683 [Paenibacillus sp. Aloe-11]
MKKYVAGFLAGALFTIGATSFADEIQSLVGKKIQGETAVSVNGKSVDKAIVVEGKSYAPVRSIGEATGMKVQFGKEGIALSDESSNPINETTTPTPTPLDGKEKEKVKSYAPTLEKIEAAIKENNSLIQENQDAIDKMKENMKKGTYSDVLMRSAETDLKLYEGNIENYKKANENLEKQKAELEKQ